MKFKTKGLIIKQQNIGERDRLVWVLTESHGILRAFARGAKNIKSPKCAGTGLLSYAALTIFEGRDSYSIDEAEALEQFIGLRSDIEDMSLAQYFCELCLHLCPTGQEAKEQLRLALNSIYLLANKKRPALQIKICFEMRLITLCGYMPDLVMCDICGAYEAPEMVFVPHTGKLYCASCADKHGIQGVRLPISSITALRHTVYADFDKLFSFELKEELLPPLSLASERYVAYMTQKDYPTLQFYKAMAPL
ncbi:DNA repair protein RecO [uncultured Ruminococcus sp.]|uniref:DNA repair protein RecO n=1 Tax=uncultured Ruminococcus sp. TaxID=165186 RepID=UPI00293178D6|nr:DNA repair protein RecO [uncultured Ruminococcus sp.]